MKNRSFAALLLLLCIFPISLSAQNPAAVSVKFNDDAMYAARVISETQTRLKVEFLHSHSIYEFDNNGFVISSNGQYKKSEKVKMILIKDAGESIYSQSIVGQPEEIKGFRFGDGQVYYSRLKQVEENYFTCRFHHTGSTYAFKKEGQTWKVYTSDKGTYPVGYIIKDIFTLLPRRFFYTDGGDHIPVGAAELPQEF